MTATDDALTQGAPDNRFGTAPETGDLRASIVQTPIGELLIVGDGVVLTRIDLPRPNGQQMTAGDIPVDDALMAPVARQLSDYFSGKLRHFSVIIAPPGTAFQREVWAALCEIPFGTTTSYGQIAARIGRPKASRAVGMANNRNPIPLVIPCHRVVGGDGSLVGYAGGLPAKQFLLELEGTRAGVD